MNIRRHCTRGVLVGLLVVSGLVAASCQANPITLSGHLVATDPGTMPTTNVQVAVFSNTTRTLVAETRTIDGDFSFRADVLPAGTYRVRFSDAAWWQGASDWQHATPVIAGDGAAPLDPTVDVATATITGYNVISGRVAPSDDYPFELVVPVGSYYVLSGGLWNGSLSHHGATPITVVAGQTLDLGGIDDPGPVTWSVTGVVTGGGAPLDGATVYIVEADGLFVHTSATTDSSGAFTVNVNPSVDYKALVVDPSGTYQPLTWGAPGVTTTGGTTFSVPVTPLFGSIALGTQDLQPASP